MVDGQEALVIDGVSMRTYGYNVSTKSGRYSMPESRGDDAILPGRSGYVLSPNKPYAAGSGALSIWCNAADPTTGAVASTKADRRIQFEANMATIQRFFTRRHRLSLIQSTQPDGTVRRAYVQWTGWDEPEVGMGGQHAVWQIEYSIPAVFWEDDAGTTSQTSTTGSSLPKNLDLSNFAGMTGVIEDGLLTVTGAITNPRITDAETGAWIQYTGSVASGVTWVVDVAAATSVKGGSSVMANTTHSGGYRLFVVSNVYNNGTTPRLTLSGSGGDSNTKFNLTARRKWVSG